MALFQPRFCGLTVRDFKCSLGWSGQTSQVSLQLVQDSAMGDAPAPPPLGWPVFLQFYGLRFQGLLQKWEKSESMDGLEVYDAVVVDPREILDGVQLILGEYNGSVNGIYNLLNVYGWWESQGYGASGATGAGMPWSKVVSGLLSIVNTPAYGAFGGPLNFRGIAYGLDLSEMPYPPGYYRLGGSCNISLMEAIQQVCDDSACDFFVELVGFTIKIRVVNRNTQPAFGTIGQIITDATATSGVLRGQYGIEVRNETTSSFLVGGNKTTMHLTQGFASFWGYDLAGLPIIGFPFFHDKIAGVQERMVLNATGVADIIGSIGYLTNTVEMRCALHSQESWKQYLVAFKPALAQLVPGCFAVGAFANIKAQADLVDDAPQAVRDASNQQKVVDGVRLYNWLRNYAENYYGKQYLVQMPFVFAKLDGETNRITYTQEPTEAGYLPLGAASLGLSAFNQDVIQDADERVLPFVHYNGVNGADTQRINWSDTAIENNQMFSRVTQSNKIVFLGSILPIPCLHIQLSGALYDKALDIHGNTDVFEKLFAPANPGAIAAVDANAPGGTIGVLGIHPAARIPTTFGLALKSNVEMYGPWYVAGAPGKVRFETDQSLTPWEYGGYSTMDLAGSARVVSAVTNVQTQECGSVEMAGAPNYSLGDILIGGGPNCTNMDVSFGTSGVTTNYRFQTFTPRFGVFTRYNAERLKRNSLAAVELRRQVRKVLNRAAAANQTINAAFRGNLANLAKHLKRKSPHTVIMARAFDSNGSTRLGVGTETYEAALALTRPADIDSDDMAVMSWSGLLRPFTTSVQANFTYIPCYTDPNLPAGFTGLSRTDFDPFKAGHDIDIVTNGVAYNGMNAWQRGADADTTRGIALRGPLVVAGWGPGVDYKYYPDGANAYMANHMKKSDYWRVGAVDMLWDERRGVWTSHDLITATTPATPLPANGSVECKVGGSAAWTLRIYNRFSNAVKENTKIIAGYCVNEHKWYVIAADCT